MDTERRDDEEQSQNDTRGDENVEEFKQEVEEDPSTAKSPDDSAEQYRGG